MGDETHEKPPRGDEAFTRAVMPLLALVERLRAEFDVEVVDFSFDETTGAGEAKLRLRLPLGSSGEDQPPS
jgi:hypothetical protein